MNKNDIDGLFNSNMEELNKMNIASGSMVKALLVGIEKNGPAYVRLFNAIVNGHGINYALLEGDQVLINNVASLLNLTIIDSLIEVNHD